MFKFVESSHTDHLASWQMISLLNRLEAGSYRVKVGSIDAFCIVEVKGIEGLCDLRGPVMGDDPIGDVYWAKRGDRPNLSRMTNMPKLQSDVVQVLAMKGEIITAYFGPLAPKEVTDPYLTAEEAEGSMAFWADHALV